MHGRLRFILQRSIVGGSNFRLDCYRPTTLDVDDEQTPQLSDLIARSHRVVAGTIIGLQISLITKPPIADHISTSDVRVVEHSSSQRGWPSAR